MSFSLGWLIAIVAVGLGVVAARILIARTRAPGRIVFLGGPRIGESILLRQGRMSIGALSDNDIVIPAAEVSRYHAEIRVRERRIQIWDLQSANGTRVNGVGIKTAELKPGDTIGIANVEIRYER